VNESPLFLCLCGCLLATAIGVPVVVSLPMLLNASRAPDAARKLAVTLGWQTLNQAANRAEVWYGGTAADHRVAIRPVKIQSYNLTGFTRRQYTFYLRIAMEVHCPEGVGVVKPQGIAGTPQRFEDALSTERIGDLPETARAAMLSFVQKGHTPALYGSSLRVARGSRLLSLYDRSAAGEVIDADVLPDAAVVLIHHSPNLAFKAEEFRALLDEMLEVAQAIASATRSGASLQVSDQGRGSAGQGLSTTQRRPICPSK
jgi:hypothetical protein